MTQYNNGTFSRFNLRLKISLNTYTKKKIEYLASELEKEILLLIQIMNLKTNYNTLELLEKTKVHEDLVDGKRELETKRKKLEEDKNKLASEYKELAKEKKRQDATWGDKAREAEKKKTQYENRENTIPDKSTNENQENKNGFFDFFTANDT